MSTPPHGEENVAGHAKTRARATPPTARKRSGRRRRATAGDLEAVRRELWYGLRRVGQIFDDENADHAEICRAANSLSVLANAYARVSEVADLAGRVEALEAAEERRGAGPKGHA